jgi:hypothetical protein
MHFGSEVVRAARWPVVSSLESELLHEERELEVEEALDSLRFFWQL